MKIRRVLILHGWGADSHDNWFPWLKGELEKKGVDAYCPDLPETNVPKQEAWLSEIRKLAGGFDSGLALVGHSLGTIAIMRTLESLRPGEKIGKAVLVSGFTWGLDIREISDFFKTEFDWEKIRGHAHEITVMNSDNDPYFPVQEGEKLRDNLKAKLIVEHGAGHINEGSPGFRKRLLETLLE